MLKYLKSSTFQVPPRLQDLLTHAYRAYVGACTPRRFGNDQASFLREGLCDSSGIVLDLR